MGTLSACIIPSTAIFTLRQNKRIARSTLAAETLALLDGIDNAIFINNVLKLILGEELQMLALVDSKQLFDAIKSSKTVLEKRLRIDISSIKENIRKSH